MRKDYYETLSVDKPSNQDDIKKAYRKLAFQYHPDRNHGNKEAENRLKEINEAYEVLGNPDRKSQYDSISNLSGDNLFGGEYFTISFNSLFEDLFGEVFNVGRKRQTERGRDLRYDLDLKFKEAAFGMEREIVIPKRDKCAKCNGKGASIGGDAKCATCNGTGVIKYSESLFAINRPCSACNGRGYVIVDACYDCTGEGYVINNHTVKVTVPPGLDDGMRLKIRGEGEESISSGPSGDLYVKVHIKEDLFFKREGVDIFCDVPVSFTHAALGAEIKVPTLEGLGSIDIPPGTQSGQTFRLESRGIPSLERGFNLRGDLFVTVNVEVPINLNTRQMQLLEKFRSEQTEEINPKIIELEEKYSDYYD